MMELTLSKVDYIQVGITQQKCMQLLPISGGTQKIVVGDNDGAVQVLGVKHAQAKAVFKTSTNAPVSRVVLGGPLGEAREKIFVSAGSDIRGYTKKGKQFLQFDTNMTEPVKAIHVEGPDLFVCGTATYQHYLNLQDKDYLLSPDKVNDLLCLPMHKVEEATPVLACQDRVLRVLQGSSLHYEVEVPGPPTVVAMNTEDGGESGHEILYGTSDGKIGLVQIDSENPLHRWEVMNSQGLGGIMSIDTFDITGDGVRDLIIGRDDGSVEVYTFDESDEPQLKYNTTCNECVTSVQGGIVSHSSYPEIVCSTYAGWIFGLTSEQLTKGLGSEGDVLMSESMAAKSAELKREVEALQEQVSRGRDQYQAASQSTTAVSSVPLFHIQDKFQLNPEEAAYMICIECQASIDNVLVQSDVPVDLLDVDKNSAVVSYSHCKPEEGNFLLATYRCQANTTRLEVKIRSIEGQYGTLQVYVTPRMQPKVCQVRQFPVKPLSLHRRTHVFDESRPLNVLRLSGPFSLTEMHSWVIFCLPETPERPTPATSGTPGPGGEVAPPGVTLHYESTFLHTQLECNYRKGEAVFRSDNLSTISILKDVLTKEGTKKKIALNISFDISEESIEHTLRLIHPKMETLLLLAKKVQLIDPLRELTLNEPDGVSILSADYARVLTEAAQLQADYKRQPCHLERLYGMITDLYIDKFKFRGQNVKTRVPALLDFLDDYNLENLIDFFNADAA